MVIVHRLLALVLVLVTASRAMGRETPVLLAKGTYTEVAADPSVACDGSLARKICRQMERDYVAAFKVIDFPVETALFKGRARSIWFGAVGSGPIRVRAVLSRESASEPRQPGLIGFWTRMRDGVLSIELSLGVDGWNERAARKLRDEVAAAVVGLVLCDRGALWLGVGLAEVVREELDSEPDPKLMDDLRKQAAGADLGIQLELLFSLDDPARFRSGPWRSLAWGTVRLLFEAKREFVLGLVKQLHVFTSSVISLGRPGAFADELFGLFVDDLKRGDLDIEDLIQYVSDWTAGDQDAGTWRQLQLPSDLRDGLKLPGIHRVSWREVVSEVRETSSIGCHIAWVLPWKSSMKFWAVVKPCGKSLQISGNGLSGGGGLCSHPSWNWEAEPQGVEKLDVLDAENGRLAVVKLPVRRGECVVLCLAVRSPRGVGYLFTLEVGG